MNNSEKSSVQPSAPENEEDSSVSLMVGWSLFVLGLIVLMTFPFVEAFADPETPLSLRVGLGLIGTSSLLIIGRLLWKRVRCLADDPYRKVIR